MASTEQLFIAILNSQHVRDHLFPYLSTADICALRQASSACCNILTKPIFTRIHATFTPNTFTKASRVASLSRIGHHIEHLTFYLAHSEATFLPPLIHPLTGSEISFLYTPHTSMGSVLTRPKYANNELGDILTQQYPPMFHAATNVPSFINAMKHIPNMRHLTIRCPGQDPRERYRRDIVDYALISLRISLERAPLTKLTKLSLSSLHPSAFNYLRHVPGFGSVPSAGRRWKQIKKLNISVEAWDFRGSSPGLDHLKIMDDYIRNFSANLEKLSFTWIGAKGPCPIALSEDPLFAAPRATKKLFHEVTSPMSPLPVRPTREKMYFPRLRHMQIRNAIMNAPQLSNLINSHRQTVKEFDFESVVLADRASWDDALAPLDKDDSWHRGSVTASSECSLVTESSSEELPSPSAAVTAASRELLSMDLSDYGFSLEDMEAFESLSSNPPADVPPPPPQETVMSFSTKLKKRSRRRRRNHRSDDDDDASSHHRKPFHAHLKSPSTSEHFRPETPKSNITSPIQNMSPHPVLLQPTIYDPVNRSGTPDDGITAVQRNIEQEEAHRLLAEDANARMSALQKAKAAVLLKLSREFCQKKTRTAEASACRFLHGKDLSSTAFGRGMVMEDRFALESQSLLVPLVFSRS